MRKRPPSVTFKSSTEGVTNACQDDEGQSDPDQWGPDLSDQDLSGQGRSDPDLLNQDGQDGQDHAAKPGRLFGSMRLLWYRFTHWVRHSPLVLLLGLLLIGLVLGLIASSTTWPSTSSRTEVLTALVSLAGAALLLLSTSLTRIMGQVAFASGLYSPRVAARLLARPLVVWSTGLFVAVLACAGAAALTLLLGDSDQLGVLPVVISAVLFVISLLGFLAVNVDMTGTYRISNVVGAVTREGLHEIDRLYPRTVEDVDEGRSRPVPPAGEPDQVVNASGSTFGVLLGFFAPWLVPIARTHNATIVIVPAVGDYVEPGTPLFHVFGPERIPKRTLHAGIRLGAARTTEQDPLFSLRMLVDVAVRALSPAVNDPYTAVQSLDRIAQLLAVIGVRDLGEGWRVDHSGEIRVWYAAPNWDDYVLLACTEIRSFGAGVMPIARRLRAVLLDLAASVPSARRPALETQLRLLDAAVARSFSDGTERDQAMTPDRQGIGTSQTVALAVKADLAKAPAQR